MAQGQAGSSAPLPEIRKLIDEVTAHQKVLEKVRENYTYSSLETIEDMDSAGRVTKTETTEAESFFVNGHAIRRIVKGEDGKTSGKPAANRLKWKHVCAQNRRAARRR
jgi:hypothetical protein